MWRWIYSSEGLSIGDKQLAGAEDTLATAVASSSAGSVKAFVTAGESVTEVVAASVEA